MSTHLQDVEKFVNDDEFNKTKAHVEELVRSGLLNECGLDPSQTSRFVEVYKDGEGYEWHLAIPDHAFRGYLKKQKSEN